MKDVMILTRAGEISSQSGHGVGTAGAEEETERKQETLQMLYWQLH